jgi:multiple sugar transport system permease protein
MATTVRPNSRRRREPGLTAVTVVAGLVIVGLTYFPIIFMLSNSLKTGENLATHGVFALFNQFDVQNYADAWHGVQTPLLNTVLVAVASILLGVTAALLGAYAFSQAHFRGKSVVFLAYISLLMIPSTLTIIPLFLEIKSFGFYDSWWALLFESARVDGAAEYKVLLRIVAPLTMPIIMTGAILMTITVWGDYIWPQVTLQNYHKYTISAGLQQYVSSLGISGAGAGSVFAAYVLAMLPMFVLVGATMRYFVSGITDGAVKL